MGSSHDAPREPSYGNLVSDVYKSLEEQLAAGEAVRSLMQHPGWPHVLRLIEARRAQVDAKLDGGLLESRAAYAFEHGRRSGLRGLESAARAIVSKADDRLARERARNEDAADAAFGRAA
jgi:hypothetical protein